MRTKMENMSLSDIAAVTRDNDDDGGWGGNGNAVPGAHSIDTVATVGDDVSQAFNAVVTVPRDSPTATLNFRSTNATSVRVANVIVVKIA